MFYPNLRMFSIFAFDWPISSFADCHLAEGSAFSHFTAVSASIIRSSLSFFCIVFPCSDCFLWHFPPTSSFQWALLEFSLWFFSFLRSFPHLSASPVLAHWIEIQLFHMQLQLCCLWIISTILPVCLFSFLSNPFLRKVGPSLSTVFLFQYMLCLMLLYLLRIFHGVFPSSLKV